MFPSTDVTRISLWFDLSITKTSQVAIETDYMPPQALLAKAWYTAVREGGKKKLFSIKNALAFTLECVISNTANSSSERGLSFPRGTVNMRLFPLPLLQSPS